MPVCLKKGRIDISNFRFTMSDAFLTNIVNLKSKIGYYRLMSLSGFEVIQISFRDKLTTHPLAQHI